MMDLDGLLEAALKHAEAVLVGEPDAQIIPTWVLYGKDIPVTLIATPWEDEDDKDMMIGLMRQLMKAKGVDCYSFLSEAWTASEDVRNPIGLEPRKREDRREVVLITACSRESARLAIYEIKRGPDARVTELVFEDAVGQSGGRLSNLLQ